MLRRVAGADTGLLKSLPKLAVQTLSYFEEVSDQAAADLDLPKGAGLGALAVENTLTSFATCNLGDISEEVRRNLQAVILEPAIARVVVLNGRGEPETIFITPSGAPRAKWGDVRVASYHSPMGRLAALRPGTDVDIPKPGGVESYEVVARALLHPRRDQEGWDSKNTVVEALQGAPLSIKSLRAVLLPAADDKADPLAFLDQLLAATAQADNVQEGVRRARRVGSTAPRVGRLSDGHGAQPPRRPAKRSVNRRPASRRLRQPSSGDDRAAGRVV